MKKIITVDVSDSTIKKIREELKNMPDLNLDTDPDYVYSGLQANFIENVLAEML